MIISRVFLSCSHIDCMSSNAPDYKPNEWFATARQARFAAKKDGWTNPRGRGRRNCDLCPKHSKPTEEASRG